MSRHFKFTLAGAHYTVLYGVSRRSSAIDELTVTDARNEIVESDAVCDIAYEMAEEHFRLECEREAEHQAESNQEDCYLNLK